MSIDQRSATLISALEASSVRRSAGNHPLQEAAQRLGDVRDGRSRLKAKDLVGLLLCHGARAWRASQPVTQTRIASFGPAGRPAIHLRLR